MKCPHCNSDIADDSKFCSSCGKETLSQNNNLAKKLCSSLSLKTILMSIAVGIWVLVLQNIGLIPINQDVRVTNTVETKVNNAVDVNLQYINGHSNVFFNNPSRGQDDKYYVIPVTVE